MCRPMTDNSDLPSSPHRDRLHIKAFHLRLTLSSAAARRLPEALTLLYLPNNLTDAFQVNGTKIRPGAPAISALHRTRTAEPAGGGEAVFASVDRVKAGEGLLFEVYMGAERVLEGGFRGGKAGWWAMDADVGASAAEVCVVDERGVLMKERVKLRRRRGRGFCLKLAEIPEEEVVDGCESSEEVMGSWSDEEWRDGGGDEVGEMEGVRWAVDVGIWVVCLGVGLLVSRASSKSWRRLKLF